MNITDNELRGIVLKKYYDKRRDGMFQWKSEDFADVQADFDADDLFRICDQLGEYNLIKWKGIPSMGKTIGGIGTISAFGVDVIEGKSQPPISINLDQSRHITVSSSSNVQIGDSNIQGIHVEIGKLVDAIDHSEAAPEDKEEAKSLLSKFLAHPVTAAVIGGLASNLKPPGQ